MTDIQLLDKEIPYVRQKNISVGLIFSLVREEFLKQPVGNANTYGLKLKNAMSGEFMA